MRAWLLIGLVACGGGSGGPTDSSNEPGQPVGRTCDPGGGTDETVIASPSLDCTTRLCLQVANSTPAMCTAECVDARECESVPESACTAGFVCAPAVSVGPFACKNVCICADRVPVTSCL